ncbi:helix-turn-helix domain-containing protein [Pinibacter aurantiacus]|uniref:AraC family transcriptional regulator n=1 Tax=Pinibacter aurantiacus TaxID=2851599 RepID=A0A9E2SCE4_9BACT|nr:AraC family transcriptional regulator [Pinibacter aurantiacus]MBV4357325.1 AraC family transcriptional regulator [Pinibacter aurantiacus]
MIRLYSDVYGQLMLSPKMLNGYVGDILPGSEPLSYNGEAGEILIQQRFFDNFSFFCAYFLFNQKSKVTIDHTGFTFQYLLGKEETFNTHIQGAGKFLIRKEHFILVQDPLKQASFVFEKGKNYFAIGSSFGLDFIEMFLEEFIALKKNLRRLKENKPFAVTKSPRFAPRKIMDVLYEIIHCPFSGQLGNTFMENKIEELFMLLLSEAFNKPEKQISLSEEQQEALHEARRIILEDISKHFLLKDISRKIHLNLHALKKGFKQLFGKNAYDYLIEARLHEAKKLLAETDKPIKEIGAMVGYSRPSSFGAAFTKYFGYPPASVRKK